MLVRHLPPESATKTALRNAMDDTERKRITEDADPSEGQWSQTEMLLALIYDAMRWQIHISAGGKGKKPDPLPRPGVKSRKRRKRAPLSPEKAEFLFRRINPPDTEPDGG